MAGLPRDEAGNAASYASLVRPLLLPTWLIIGVFLLLPVLLMVVYSFLTKEFRGGVEWTFTLAAYERTLLNVREENADFLVDLGDTFMNDKRGSEWKRADAQYDAQRYWFGVACRDMPLFMVLGNHDGERGGSGGRDAEMPAWSYAMRTARFPAPEVTPDGMYTGRTAFAGGQGANYYAFEWGDAQIVVLDPFWSTTDRIRGGSGGGSASGWKRSSHGWSCPLLSLEWSGPVSK